MIFKQISLTLTSTVNSDQSDPGSNGYEGGTQHSSEIQNWSLTARYSLVS